MDKRKLITDLQSQGLKLLDLNTGRKGGAGPSDHKAVTINDTTVMIPIHNSIAAQSEYTLADFHEQSVNCLLYTSPSPRDLSTSRMPSSA